jgi:HlyD family secretion protein
VARPPSYCIIGLMRGKRSLIAAAVVVAVVAAAALYLARRRARPAATGAPVAPATTPGPAQIVLPAILRAQHVTPVAAPIEGTIEALLVEAGEQVYEGQLLGRIRNTALAAEEQSAAAELERTQARLEQFQNQLISARLEAARARAEASRVQSEFERAERAYSRQQMLYKEGATPRLVYEKSAREYEAVRTTRDGVQELARGAEDRTATIARSVDAARRLLAEKSAARDEARQHAAAAEIRSPVTGLVVGRSRQPGDEVTAEVQDLFEIATDTAALEAVIQADPATLARLRPGQEAFISLADAPEVIAAPVDQVRAAEAIIRFTSPNPAVRPGATAQVRINVR